MSTTRSDLISLRKANTPLGLTNMSDVYVDRAVNAEVWDIDGNRYIDFASGTSTLNVGHSHPRVLDALHTQVDRFTHTFFQQLPYESYVRLAERLNVLVPGKFNKRTVLFTDGATAVENAIRVARTYTRRNAIISFQGGYHGRTHLTATISGKVKPYKDGLLSPSPDIHHIPFNDDAGQNIKRLFKYTVDPSNVAAIIIEPIQGESGFNISSDKMMRAIRDICNDYGIVFIVDEVQCGFGRTGKMFAMEHYSVVADMVCMSKSLAAGIPMSAVTGKAEIMDDATYGGTFSGNPLGCVAAHAVLDIIRDEKLVERSCHLGSIVKESLSTLNNEYVKDVRGVGSMIAIEFNSTSTSRTVQQRARDSGLILITGGFNAECIRLLYPLTIEESVLREGLGILHEAINDARV
jgi:4-aminobutyrate aminotransferase